MKATIDFDDALYRRLKIEAARRGTTIRELVDQGVRTALGMRTPRDEGESQADTTWFGSLRRYAGKAKGRHTLPEVRESIGKGRMGTRR